MNELCPEWGKKTLRKHGLPRETFSMLRRAFPDKGKRAAGQKPGRVDFKMKLHRVLKKNAFDH